MHGVGFYPLKFVRFLWSCVPWFPFGVSLAAGTLGSFFPGPPVILWFLISAFLLVGWFLKQFFHWGTTIWRHQWLCCARHLALVIFALPLVFVGVMSGDYLHLAMLYPFYRAKIAETSDRPVRFSWGDHAVSVLDGLRFKTLAYDDTGQLAATPPRVDEGICTMNRRFIGNFFIEESISAGNLISCGYARR